jgi:glycosyltransferase involved in cell wall biosynthesis
LSTILHLITGLGSGGAERMLTRVATTGPAASAGHRQIVVSMTDDGRHVNGPILERAGIPVHWLGMRRGRPSIAAFMRLLRLLRRERPDILMTWLYHADLLGILVAPLAGIRRVIWNVRCSEVDFDSYPRTTRWTVALLARLSSRPWAVGVNSQAGRRVHEALGYRPAQWCYLPNGVDVAEWRPDSADRASVRNEVGLDPEQTAIVTVARADPMKDHGTLLAAAERVLAQHPQTRFFLVGRGTEKLPIPAAIRSSVIALGERTDVHRLLRGFDIHVLSSKGEGFPNAVVEAMATGLVCVATDVGDAAALVGDTGPIVPAGDPGALAAAIGSLIQGRVDLEQQGRRARDRVLMHWSLDRALSAYHELWRRAFAGDRASFTQQEPRGFDER